MSDSVGAPELDAALITADGFFRTGDLGVLSVVVSEQWSVENESLAPTLKVKRAHVEAAVGKRPVLWT